MFSSLLNTVTTFIAYSYKTQCSASTITTYLSALSQVNKIVAAASTTTSTHIEYVDDTKETVDNAVPPRVIMDETAVEYGEGFLLWLETKEVDYIDIVHLSNLVKFAKKVRDDRKTQKKIVDFLKIKLSNWHRVYYLAKLT